MVCLTLSISVVILAYLNNYESVRTNTGECEIILLLLLINVIANIAQIEEFLEKIFDKENEENLSEILYDIAENLKLLLREKS